MGQLFLNGPVQNGPFTFESHPGKAVGIRLAAILNAVLGSPIVPHLWNTVTLAGDLRYRGADVPGVPRQRFEADLIDGKYPPGAASAGGIVTDNDDEVADLALEMIESRLRTGGLVISDEVVPVCQACGHMAGEGAGRCCACGGTDIRGRSGRHLVAEPVKDRPVLDCSEIHAWHRQQPKHLQHTAGSTARRLILSRTRDYGIDLSPLGLDRLVLDPRTGVHVTVLAVAHRHQADVAVMTTTQNAANHIAAHGQHFREYDGIRLRYALHGLVPYDRVGGLLPNYEAVKASPELIAAFETCFLPLHSLKEKTATSPAQLAALFTFFRRACGVLSTEPSEAALAAVRREVRLGGTDWISRKAELAAALAMLIG